MSNDYFKFKQFMIRQDSCAMKVGTDSTLLGAWALAPLTKRKNSIKILDIGTGTGIIAIMMAQRFPNSTIVGIDIDSNATLQAEENVLNTKWSDRITIKKIPLQKFHDDNFDVIVCNPPFFTSSLICADPHRTLSRHTTSLSYDELAKYSYRLLSLYGEFSIIYPYDQRKRMESAIALAGFFEKRRCLIRTKTDRPPKRILSSYTKEPQNTLVEELLINSTKHKELLSDFYM